MTDGGDMFVGGYFGSDESQLNWHTGAIFFALTTVTTLGYGSFVPETSAGKGASIVYGLFGVLLFGYALTLLNQAVEDSLSFFIAACVRPRAAKRAEARARARQIWKKGFALLAEKGKLHRNGKVLSFKDAARSKTLFLRVSHQMKDHWREKTKQRLTASIINWWREHMMLAVSALLFVGWLCTMATIFQRAEHWESFTDGVYFAFVSSAMIGFGDFTPDRTKHLISTYGCLLVGTALE